jgi:hypothetical protein
MHLLPQSFDIADDLILLPRSFVGMTALLLPAVVRFYSKSLLHLLPRQAFSIQGPAKRLAVGVIEPFQPGSDVP